eukprot:3604609-Pleurochrysis_carterae.AAC.1
MRRESYALGAGWTRWKASHSSNSAGKNALVANHEGASSQASTRPSRTDAGLISLKNYKRS